MHFWYGNGVGVKTRITNRYSIESPFQVNKPVCNVIGIGINFDRIGVDALR